MGAPVRFQKAVSRSKENAAVERRQANAHRHWAYAARRQDVTPRLSALRSLTFREGRCFPRSERRENHDGAPRASATRGGEALWFARRLFENVNPNVIAYAATGCSSGSTATRPSATSSSQNSR